MSDTQAPTSKKLSQLTNDSSAANDDEIIVFKGEGAARRVTKAEFLADRDNTDVLIKTALLSLGVKTGSLKLPSIPATGVTTINVDIAFDNGYTSQLANLTRFLISVAGLSVVNSYYDGNTHKLVAMIGNSTGVTQTGAVLFYSIPTFSNSGLA